MCLFSGDIGATLKGIGCWGSQNGLLSSGEVQKLYEVVHDYARKTKVAHGLEVGHYYGLSTCALVRALESAELNNPMVEWSLLSIDAHCSDPWVPASDPSVYFTNRDRHFYNPRLQTLIARSEGIVRIDGFDWVFYDGDHGDEQARWTELVIASPRVELFVFDDRDFGVPFRCAERLRAAGWIDESPELVRTGEDKSGASAMTLGIFRRA